jgi:hypothetical protein
VGEPHEAEVQDLEVEPDAGQQVVAINATFLGLAPAPEGAACTDVPPDANYTCGEQVGGGRAAAGPLASPGVQAAERARPTWLPRHAPPALPTQAALGKCNAVWLTQGNFCAASCGRPPCPPVTDLTVAVAPVPECDQ